jgi:hypothetical protein
MTPRRPSHRAASATGAAGSDSGSEVPDVLRVDRESEKHQPKRLDSFMQDRDERQMQRRREEIMPDVFGEYTPTF